MHSQCPCTHARVSLQMRGNQSHNEVASKVSEAKEPCSNAAATAPKPCAWCERRPADL